MSQPKKPLSELLSINGNRVFTITEKQFYGIINGWTHLELMDEKSIFEFIYETGSTTSAELYNGVNTAQIHKLTLPTVRMIRGKKETKELEEKIERDFKNKKIIKLGCDLI
jgi:hypothetical protein